MYPDSIKYTTPDTDPEITDLIKKYEDDAPEMKQKAKENLKVKKLGIVNDAVKSIGYKDIDTLITRLDGQNKQVSLDISKLQNRLVGVLTGPSGPDFVVKSTLTNGKWALAEKLEKTHADPALLAVQKPDEWVKVGFKTTKEDNQKASQASSTSVSAEASADYWFASTSASTSVSEATSYVKHSVLTCE